MHTVSMLTDADIRVDGDIVTVRAQIPRGIGLDLRLHFRHWTYRCRLDGDALEFLDYEAGPAGRD